MHVIGVAEPDDPSPEAEAEAAGTRRHLEFENYMGKNLALVSDILVTAGVWGFNGMRQRILVSAILLVSCRCLVMLTFDRFIRSTPMSACLGSTISREVDSRFPPICGLACHPFSPLLLLRNCPFTTRTTHPLSFTDSANPSAPIYEYISKSSHSCSEWGWHHRPPSSHTGSSSSQARAYRPSSSPPVPKLSMR